MDNDWDLLIIDRIFCHRRKKYTHRRHFHALVNLITVIKQAKPEKLPESHGIRGFQTPINRLHNPQSNCKKVPDFNFKFSE